MCWFPIHACPFESRLHDQLVGTFDHARAERPSLPLILGVLHERHPLAKIVHLLLHGLKLSDSIRQALTPAQKQTWSSMLEDM